MHHNAIYVALNKPAVLVFARYNSNNILVDIQCKNVNIDEDSYEDYRIENAEGTGYIKAMLFNSLGELKPLAEPQKLDYSL